MDTNMRNYVNELMPWLACSSRIRGAESSGNTHRCRSLSTWRHAVPLASRFFVSPIPHFCLYVWLPLCSWPRPFPQSKWHTFFPKKKNLNPVYTFSRKGWNFVESYGRRSPWSTPSLVRIVTHFVHFLKSWRQIFSIKTIKSSKIDNKMNTAWEQKETKS